MGDILINMIVYTSSGIINYRFWADPCVCPNTKPPPYEPWEVGVTLRGYPPTQQTLGWQCDL